MEDNFEPIDESKLRGDAADDVEESEENSSPHEDTTVHDEKLSDAEGSGEVKQEPQPQKDRSQHIPRERFDEVNNRLKVEREARESLEARLAALEAPPAKQEPSIDLKALLKEYNLALMDQDEERVDILSEQIEEERYRRAEAAAERKAEAKFIERENANAHQAATQLFDGAVADIIGQYPVLDIASPEADHGLIDEVVDFRDLYITKGMQPHEALRKAVSRIMGNPVAQKTDERKANQVRVNADTARRQPVSLGGTGNRAIGEKETIISQEEWNALPEKERVKRLRGD